MVTIVRLERRRRQRPLTSLLVSPQDRCFSLLCQLAELFCAWLFVAQVFMRLIGDVP